MNEYSYEGPVFRFGQCIANCWKGKTYAVSENKARNNLMYQFKKNYNLEPYVKISMPGNITMA